MRWNNLESYSLATSHALEEAALEPVPASTRLIVKVLLALLALFLVWAALFHIEIIASGSGKVVPVSTVQQLQPLESGVVAEIRAREGDIVKKGDVLFRLNPAQAMGDVAERQATREGLMAAIARLRAETDGSEPRYPEELRQTEDGRKTIETEEKLRRERAETLDAQVSVLRQQRAQKAAEAADFRGRLPQTQKALQLVQEQLALVEPLSRAGAAAPMEMIQLRKEEANLRSQVVANSQGAVSADAQVREFDDRIRERQNQFRSESRDDMSKRQTQLNSLEGGLAAKQDVLARTEVRSPVNGIVKVLYVTTVGGVASAGKTLVEVVPLDDTLLVEARVKPSDIAYLRTGLPAKVHVSAFDSGLYGAMDAVVERISPDSQTEERTGAVYYRLYVRTRSNAIETSEGRLAILPGMVADVDVITGRRTVLAFLLRPIARGLQSTMGER
ncbi:MAG: HlyD family type I secretion periplasmic adaptor subunit [Betaproteobacteria bacterium]|nr:HlyD family type I secretion periplasmic adaptor subunit [Betaproteobacteria bacterium]